MNLQPHLKGELITLQPLSENDFTNLYLAASDPLIWEQHPESTRYQEPVFRQFFALALESKGAFVVIDQKTEKIIGSTRYYDFSPERKQVIIGYTFLRREYWGGLYNREMKSLMLNHAFLSVKSVLFEIGEANLRSRKALEKIGGQWIGQCTLDNKSHVIYEIKRNEMNRS